jgi:hypothetical protein
MLVRLTTSGIFVGKKKAREENIFLQIEIKVKKSFW